MATVPVGFAPLGQERAQQLQRALHRPCGEQQLGHEVLFFLVAFAHLVHRRHHGARDQRERVHVLGNRLSGHLDGRPGVAVQNRVIELFQIGHGLHLIFGTGVNGDR